MTSKSPKKKDCNPLELQSFTIICRLLQVYATSLPVPKRGLGGVAITSYPTKTSTKPRKASGAKSGASFDIAADSRLQALITHWATLPETLRESVFRQVCETLILQNLPSTTKGFYHDEK